MKKLITILCLAALLPASMVASSAQPVKTPSAPAASGAWYDISPRNQLIAALIAGSVSAGSGALTWHTANRVRSLERQLALAKLAQVQASTTQEFDQISAQINQLSHQISGLRKRLWWFGIPTFVGGAAALGLGGMSAWDYFSQLSKPKTVEKKDSKVVTDQKTGKKTHPINGPKSKVKPSTQEVDNKWETVPVDIPKEIEGLFMQEDVPGKITRNLPSVRTFNKKAAGALTEQNTYRRRKAALAAAGVTDPAKLKAAKTLKGFANEWKDLTKEQQDKMVHAEETRIKQQQEAIQRIAPKQDDAETARKVAEAEFATFEDDETDYNRVAKWKQEKDLAYQRRKAVAKALGVKATDLRTKTDRQKALKNLRKPNENGKMDPMEGKRLAIGSMLAKLEKDEPIPLADTDITEEKAAKLTGQFMEVLNSIPQAGTRHSIKGIGGFRRVTNRHEYNRLKKAGYALYGHNKGSQFDYKIEKDELKTQLKRNPKKRNAFLLKLAKEHPDRIQYALDQLARTS